MRTLAADGHLKPYSIHIAPGLIGELHRHLGSFADNGRLIVVSDRSVWTRYRKAFSSGCRDLKIEPIVIAPGEMSKSWASLKMLVNKLLHLGVNRESTIIAFGGGVVGDLVGFAASILHRGCSYVQMPTTLLSQVDSSVGGKTAINTRQGKNQVGTIHDPSLVLIDPTLLPNLTPRQLRSGYAEILKIALINRPTFFDWLERNASACLDLDMDRLCEAIARAVEGKISIIRGDEQDMSGRRILLNFGHSFGHAIEAATSFRVPHGEAVALGMMMAFELSNELELCPAEDVSRVRSHLSLIGLPTRLGKLDVATRGSSLGAHFASDKKMKNGSPQFIMTRGIGKAFAHEELGLARVNGFLERIPS